MKKLFLFALMAFAIGCSDKYDDTEIKQRLDNLEGVRIPSVESQIASIQASLPLLQQANTEIKGYISTLQNKVGTLEQAKSDIDVKIKALEYTLQNDFSQQLANIVSQLDTYKQEVQQEIDALNKSIETLKASDKELENKISYLDGKIDMQKDWVTATFTTLTQYNGLVTDIAAIQTNIEAINQSIADLETRLNKKIETDIATAVSGLQKEVGQKVTEITNAYTAAIGTAKDEITSAYTSAISSAIDKCVASMKDWVNDKLANYYNIATIDAKVQLLQNAITDGDKKLNEAIKQSEIALNAAIEQGDQALEESIKKNVADLQTEITANKKALQKEIDATNTALETAKTELTEAYTNAIKTAIETNNGLINKKIAEEIATVTERIDSEVETLNNKISAIENRIDELEREINDKILALDNRVSGLETDVAALLKRIQSISYIPRYNDGQVVMKKIIDQDEGIAEFDFMISPKDAVNELAKVWNDAVTMKAVYTQTRAVLFVDLPILDFTTDTQNGVITLKVSGENLSANYWINNMSASAALFISDGNNSIVSEYVPMIADFVSDYIVYYTTTDGKIVSPQSGFGVGIIANTYIGGQGKIVLEGNATSSGNFYECRTLKTIILPNSVTRIVNNAFRYCENLSSITIGDNVEIIDNSAFDDCRSLTTMTLPASIKEIRYNALDCPNLTSFYCKAIIPPTIETAYNFTETQTIYVPQSSVNAYKEAKGWSSYASQIVGYDFYYQK